MAGVPLANWATSLDASFFQSNDASALAVRALYAVWITSALFAQRSLLLEFGAEGLDEDLRLERAISFEVEVVEGPSTIGVEYPTEGTVPSPGPRAA